MEDQLSSVCTLVKSNIMLVENIIVSSSILMSDKCKTAHLHKVVMKYKCGMQRETLTYILFCKHANLKNDLQYTMSIYVYESITFQK